MKQTPTVSVREAAQRLGCTLKWVYDLLYSGRLPGQKQARCWRIPESAIAARLKKTEANGGTAGR